MRKQGRVDANQDDIVSAFRKMGASVHVTSNLGGGFSDIVIGYRGLNMLVEIKDGSKPPSKQELTHDEKKFRDSWRGAYAVIKSVSECQGLLNSMAEHARLIINGNFI